MQSKFSYQVHNSSLEQSKKQINISTAMHSILRLSERWQDITKASSSHPNTNDAGKLGTETTARIPKNAHKSQTSMTRQVATHRGASPAQENKCVTAKLWRVRPTWWCKVLQWRIRHLRNVVLTLQISHIYIHVPINMHYEWQVAYANNNLLVSYLRTAYQCYGHLITVVNMARILGARSSSLNLGVFVLLHVCTTTIDILNIMIDMFK